MSTLLERLKQQSTHILEIKSQFKSILNLTNNIPSFQEILEGATLLSQYYNDAEKSRVNIIAAINAKGKSLPNTANWDEIISGINSLQVGYTRANLKAYTKYFDGSNIDLDDRSVLLLGRGVAVSIPGNNTYAVIGGVSMVVEITV